MSPEPTPLELAVLDLGRVGIEAPFGEISGRLGVQVAAEHERSAVGRPHSGEDVRPFLARPGELDMGHAELAQLAGNERGHRPLVAGRVRAPGGDEGLCERDELVSSRLQEAEQPRVHLGERAHHRHPERPP